MPLPLEGGSFLTSFQDLDRYGQYMQPPKSGEDTPAPSIKPQVMGQTVVGGNQLVGQVDTQPMMGGMPGNVIFVQQPSAAPKVIGIFTIIYGVFQVLGSLMLVLGASLLGDEISEAVDLDSSMLMVMSVIGFLMGGAWIIAGVWMNGRQRRGVHLGWLLLLLEFIIDIVFSYLNTSSEAINPALGIGMSVVGTGICGVIIAIPLMVSNSGLDDSSLIPK